MTWFVLVESNTTGSGRQFCAAARELGLRPVVLTRHPERYPYLATDAVDHLPVDTADQEAVSEACRALAGDGGLAGVTSSSEYFIATAAAAAARLGLPAADPQALTRCRHKDLQRAALAAAGVPVPAHRAVGGLAEALAAADELGYPVVVKPTTGSGSVGVRLCAGPEDLAAHAAPLLDSPVNERGQATPGLVLVEEYVTGREFSVETFDHEVVGVVGKHLGPPPHFVETGHDFPAPAAPAELERLADTTTRAVRALGLGWGAAHTELRLGPRGPVVIEVNPRLAGGMIPSLVRLATGVDLVAAVVARAAGTGPSLTPDRAGHASIRFALAHRAGTVRAVDGAERAAALPGVELAETTVAPGTEFEPTHSFRDRFGYAVATGPDAATAADRATRAAALLSIETS
ncbi:biotin carboxylase [Streptomyces sp. 1114.5]|uniref:ATP-grasp domain-containing protein n=1 Tax=Streptomyces sp. 1114.5 TaxID=1938830 RepID=UPI000EB2EB89|nr:ATP-grasp domain-containing protein [Streptomyces sp. 1114.5]RKT17070.1 biotin carboxylase [Streptomyces sp. 1114.5]